MIVKKKYPKIESYFVCSDVVKLAEITAMHDGAFSPLFMVAPFAPLKSASVKSLIAALDFGSSIPSGRQLSAHSCVYFSKVAFE